MIQTNLLQHFRTKKNALSSQLSTNTKNTKILDDADKYGFESKPEIKIETKILNKTLLVNESYIESSIKIDNKNPKKRSRGIMISE